MIFFWQNENFLTKIGKSHKKRIFFDKMTNFQEITKISNKSNILAHMRTSREGRGGKEGGKGECQVEWMERGMCAKLEKLSSKTPCWGSKKFKNWWCRSNPPVGGQKTLKIDDVDRTPLLGVNKLKKLKTKPHACKICKEGFY